MKLLFIVAHPNYHVGGAEIQSYRLAVELSNLGNQISFLMARPGNINKSIIEEKDENGFSIYFFKRGKVFKLFSSIRAYHVIKNIKPECFYMRGVLHAWPAAIVYSKKKRRAVRVIWQVPSGRSLIRFANIKELFRVETAGPIIRNFLDNLYEDLIQLFTIRFSDIIISQTDRNLQVLKETFNRDSRKVLKGIRIESNEIEKEFLFPLKIYFIRNIKPRSRLKLFLDVYSLIQKSDHKDSFEFCIIGENQGSMDIRFLEDCRHLKYYGKLSNAKVLEHLKSAHILIDTLWEQNDQTTYSTVFIEALINKVVIFSFDTNPDEVLTKHRIGFKVNSPEECANRIIELKQNLMVLKNMSQNAYRYALSNHDISNEVKFLSTVIQKNQAILMNDNL